MKRSDAPDSISMVSLALSDLLAEVGGGGGARPPPDGETTVDGQWLPDRYQDLGQLGMGGMGEVRRVLDRHLNRTVAMKVIRPSLVYSPEAMARFLEEAQIAAQLEHPGIVPVYEAGRLPDGRLYFTMKEVHGWTLDKHIDAVHAASAPGRWESSAGGWTLRRLVDAFHVVCEAMAYAHARGVIHRDLKPGNVMTGSFGEVQLLDWGLGKVLGAPRGEDARPPAGLPVLEAVVRTERSASSLFETRVGEVGGTLLYMPPEQARGEVADMGPPTDVYALGAILYQILAGQPPFQVGSTAALLKAQEKGPSPPGRVVGDGPGGQGQGALPIPEELWTLCSRALSFDAARRPPHAGALAAEVSDWLEGARRRERGLVVVREADELGPRIARLRERARELRQSAERLLEEVPPMAPVRRKRPAWEAQDQAARLEREAVLAEERMVQSLHAALSHQPDLAEAHTRLARYYRAAHAEAEAQGDAALAARLEMRLRAHDDGEHAVYLSGDGSLTLLTSPPGAQVVLRPYQELDRRLVPGEGRSLGQTPVFARTLPMGSYRVELLHPDALPVGYPISIGRHEHWHGVPPGEGAPQPIALPAPGQLRPDEEVYVPAGWCRIGGDQAATRGLDDQELWIDGFVIERFPVTNARYIEFLDDLQARGDEALALDCVPRERGARPGVPGAAVYGRDEAGRFVLLPDAEGDVWHPEWPVVLVHWDAAVAFARWSAERSGLPWRLPSELEWEKAARGPDRRIFPWGRHFDLTWCLTQDSQAGRMMPVTVTAFPEDQSPYGVRGMAGNTRDWCREADGETEALLGGGRLELGPLSPGGPDTLRLTRGGCWYSHHRDARACSRVKSPQAFRAAGVGIRLARSWPLPGAKGAG